MIRILLSGTELDEGRLGMALASEQVLRVGTESCEPSASPTRSYSPDVLVAVIAAGLGLLGSILGPLLTEIYKARQERRSQQLKPVSSVCVSVTIICTETRVEQNFELADVSQIATYLSTGSFPSGVNISEVTEIRIVEEPEA